MTTEAQPHAIPDEEFLDEVFERAVALCETGASTDSAELLAGREHLRAEVEALFRTARLVTPIRAESLPSVPGYTLLAEIGRGGMGAVYLARQEQLGGRRVALKVLPSSAGLSARARERFLVEARALAGLRHPHVVTVHDVVADAGVHAYAMEWVDGASLGQLLDHLRTKGRDRSPDDTASAKHSLTDVRELLGEGADPAAATYPIFVCRIGVAIARALAALHRSGLVHRDVKPSNILLRKDGTPLLSDFGLVHAQGGELTHSGQFAGTVAYASPEQLGGDPESLDARSDVYALGVTLYHALTLHLPFDDRRGRTPRASTSSAMLRLIESGRAAPLRTWSRRLPRDLETIVAKAIEPNPARRYPTADELADDLERLLALQPIRARPGGWVGRVAKFVRRNRAAAVGLGIGSVLSLALAAALVVYLFLAPRWVEEHVRDARLALLDPSQATQIFNVVFYGESQREAGYPPLVKEEALVEAARHYDAALRWAPFDATLRAEREVVAAARGEPAASHTVKAGDQDDSRAAGLLDFLRGDVESALEHWERFEAGRDPTASPDALVEAALGILYLVQEEPARAYPRLRAACQTFSGVGFLTTYLADAALQCGDLRAADRLLGAAADMPRPDPFSGHQRVLADLRAAQGRAAEAEALYRGTSSKSPTGLHYARFLESRGRREESIRCLVDIASIARGVRVRRECAAAIERWWNELDPEARRAEIHRAQDLSWSDPTSLTARLRAFDGPRLPDDRSAAAAAWARSSDPAAWFLVFFAALPGTASSPPLHDRSLADLVRTLEVHNMTRWNTIRAYSPLFKALQRMAWAGTHPIQTSRALDGLERWFRWRAQRLAIGAAMVASVGTAAQAQGCPGAPCFQALGDLPGGAYMSSASCLSTDGTTVGGVSSTALSSGELYDGEGFVWQAGTGMVYVGDLAGNGESGDVTGLTANGVTAVGWATSGLSDNSGWQPFPEAFRWTQTGGIVGLGDLPTGLRTSVATAVSDDGTTVFGWSHAVTGSLRGGGRRRAATWTSTGGWVDHGTPGMYDSFFARCSRNGQWAAGREIVEGTTISRAVRWSVVTGMQILGEAGEAVGTSVSDNGTVVGYFGAVASVRACIWPNGGPTQFLADLPGGLNYGVARGILRDDSLIVGLGESGAGREAVLWDEARDVHRVADVLASAGVSVPGGWILTDTYDIVRNGTVVTICGTGTNPSGQTEAWIARYDGYPTELFCFGDGTGTACPCGNHSPVGSDEGCLSSLGVGGRLRSSGTADLGADTLVLQGSQMPNSFALYFQGSTLTGGGNGTVFGDGLRCAGAIIRLGTKGNTSGASQYPQAGDPSVSVRGMVTAPGGWRYYQTWYRNAAAFCTNSTFNLTNAMRVFWTL